MSFNVPWLTKFQKNSRYGRKVGTLDVIISRFADDGSLYLLFFRNSDGEDSVYKAKHPRLAMQYGADRILRMEHDESGKQRFRVVKDRNTGGEGGWVDIPDEEVFWLLLKAKDVEGRKIC